MIKNIVKTCSCFVDKAVWFVNYSQPVQTWRFDPVKIQTRIQDIIEDKFIKEDRRSVTFINGKINVKNTFVVSCVQCFESKLSRLCSNANMMTIFDNINCRFVTHDTFTYGDSFDDDIFTGNSQFVVENWFLSREARESLFLSSGSNTDNFIRRPLHKSCFTSHQKNRYRSFCTTCKKIYNEFFESDLHVFSSIFGQNLMKFVMSFSIYDRENRKHLL